MTKPIENAPQPQQETTKGTICKCGAAKSYHTHPSDNPLALRDGRCSGYEPRYPQSAPSQPQPAESDGFEEWFSQREDSYQYGAEGPARDAWEEQERRHKAKLSSLLAQKPEATVSFDRLAEVYNDSPLDGSVSHLCVEVMKYRQLLKDAEKGQGK